VDADPVLVAPIRGDNTMPARTPALIRPASAAAILAVEIAIHAALAPAHLDEVPYIGVLFVIASVLLTVALAAILIAPHNPLGWYLGSALCAAMAAAFVISRATGLPDYHEAWTSDAGLGLISLPPELLFLIIAVGPLRSIRSPRSCPEPAPRRTHTRSTGLVRLIDRDALAVEMAQPAGPPTTSSSQPSPRLDAVLQRVDTSGGRGRLRSDHRRQRCLPTVGDEADVS
jgi:hypothetical protein